MALVAAAVALKRRQRLLQNDDCGWTARSVVDSFFRLNQEWNVMGKRRLDGTGKRGVDARIFSFKVIF